MSRLRSAFKYGKYLAFTGVAASGLYVLKSNEWDLNTLGPVRFGRTAVTVGRIVFDYKYSLSGVKGDDEESQAKWSQVHQRAADRLLKLCSTNGGVFIKVGQHIGALDYVAPKEYCDTLKVLHSHAPQSSLHDLRHVIITDLGATPEELFAEFSDHPLGTASLAQVHKAVLKETGETVAVKVQHRLVKKHSFVDMATMDILVRGVAKIFPDFSFLWLADEMKRNLPLELDFVNEGRNAERVQRMFSHLPWLRIPDIRWDYSSPRVLTMSFLEGGEITDQAYVMKHKLDPRQISDRISTLYSEMIFVEGYVHCDPHPGNILVRATDNGAGICLLDHGLYTSLPERFRHNYSQMWLAIINADVPNIKKYGDQLGAGDLAPLLACILASKSWESLTTGLTKGKKSQSDKETLRKYAAQYFPEIVKVLSTVNREMLLVMKTNDLLRGIEVSLGTRGEKRSLLNMSRYCIKSVFADKLKHAPGIIAKTSLVFRQEWTLFKLGCYQFYLWFCTKLYGSDYL